MMKTKLLLASIFTLCNISYSQDYESFRVGNPESVNVPVNYAVVAAGGATDNNDAMRWMLQRAQGGDVVVLRASGGDAYNNYFFSQLGIQMNSVETFVFNNRNASFEPYIFERLNEAEVIFIAGGDQSKYVEFWQDTPIEYTINLRTQAKDVVIGGTSAGAAILGEGYFSASNGTVTSTLAIDDPFNMYMTLGKSDFLNIPLLENTIIDTHFNNPDRRGRLAAFIARLMTPTDLNFRGIGINEYCAVAITEDGVARCFGEYPQYETDEVYFFRSDCESPTFPQQIQPGLPLIWELFNVVKIKATKNGVNSFDVSTWESYNGEAQFFYGSVVNLNFLENTHPEAQFCDNVQSVDYQTIEDVGIKITNPVIDILTLQSETSLSGLLTVYDFQGKLIEQISLKEINQANIPTREWIPGMYLLNITTLKNKTISFKVIKI